ncbi:MAG: HlyC/CorC family transporter [Magnetococcales bacterium]|nr:HlyC/CorC family transporter [Magnetococcales bacterium]
MDITLVIQLLLFAVLLGFSGMFSSSETAFFSLGQMQMEQMTREGSKKLAAIKEVLAKPRQTIVTILIGNEFVNVAASNLSATILMAMVPVEQLAIANILIMLPLLLLLGEITPKTLAVQNNIAFAKALVGPISMFSKMIGPLRWIIREISDFFTTLLIGKSRAKGSFISGDMVRTLAKQAAEDGQLGQSDYKYIENIFNFGSQTVQDVITPRGSIDFIKLGTPMDEVLRVIKSGHHTRIPVFGENKDDIVGILHYRDILREDVRQISNAEEITKYLRRPVMVPKNKPVSELFSMFYERRINIAMVVDEYGSVIGLVTMRNMLKSIFGDIGGIHQANKSMDAPWANALEPNLFQLSASIKVKTFNDYFDADLTSDGVESLAGLILNAYGELPRQGDFVVVDNWRFEIEQIERNRITQIRASDLNESTPAEQQQVADEPEETSTTAAGAEPERVEESSDAAGESSEASKAS